MNNDKKVSLIRTWFNKVKQASGPILPDGWFGGRPYENLFSLTDVRFYNENLEICLTQNTRLIILEPEQVFIDGMDLVFCGFKKASFQRLDYGGKEVLYVDEYYEGEIRFVDSSGTW